MLRCPTSAMGSAPQRDLDVSPRSTVASARAREQASFVERPLRPFLKWAGGKRQLLPRLREFYPAAFGSYHEPFLGSGAVFFDLANAGRLGDRQARLSDVNADLIGCWRQLRDAPDAMVEALRSLEADEAAPGSRYYLVRARFNRARARFNRARAEIGNGSNPRIEAYSPEVAAMFVYLNRTGFNGLFRLNAGGGFNVPRGQYKRPRICDEDNLRRVSETLAAPSVTVEPAGFDTVLRAARPGDFIYLDPPYAPLSATSAFTSYTANGFDGDDQRRLQQVVIGLAERGCHVLLSNSTAPAIAELYDGNPDAARAGLRAHTVPARRAINSNASRRGGVDEYIITNLPRRAA